MAGNTMTGNLGGFNVRIQSKIDTLSNWSSIAETFIPLRGEVCVFEIPTGAVGNPTTETPPVMLMKVGDGTTTLANLPFLAARSSDVASFLKVDSKGKTWTQDSFEAWIKTLVTVGDLDLGDYVLLSNYNEKMEELEGLISDAETAAKGHADAEIAKLADVYAPKEATATGIQEAKDAVANEKERAETAEKTLSDDIILVKETMGEVPEGSNLFGLLQTTQQNLGRQISDVDQKADANESAINVLFGTDEKTKSVRTIANEELAAQLLNENGAVDNFTTLKELATWLEQHPEDAAAMNVQISELEGDLEGLTNLVGEIPTGYKATTVVGYAEELVEALNIGDYAKAADLTDAIDRIVELEKVDHDHTNKTTLDGITDAKVGNWDDAHTKAHTHANETVLAGINADKIAAWDAAEENANGYTDEKIGGLHIVATTGKVHNLEQEEGTYLVFNCGSATTMIDNIPQQ